jgi:hypothetical protein
MKRIEFVLHQDAIQPSHADMMHESCTTAGQSLRRALGGQALYQVRNADSQERRNLQASIDAQGTLNIGRYLNLQAADRTAHRVSPDLLTMSVVGLPLLAKTNQGTIRTNIDGYALQQSHEGILTTQRGSQELARTAQLRTFMSSIALHETGHLLWLTPSELPNNQAGNHCANRCIMHVEARPTDTISLYNSLKADPFCPACKTYALKKV